MKKGDFCQHPDSTPLENNSSVSGVSKSLNIPPGAFFVTEPVLTCSTVLPRQGSLCWPWPSLPWVGSSLAAFVVKMCWLASKVASDFHSRSLLTVPEYQQQNLTLDLFKVQNSLFLGARAWEVQELALETLITQNSSLVCFHCYNLTIQGQMLYKEKVFTQITILDLCCLQCITVRLGFPKFQNSLPSFLVVSPVRINPEKAPRHIGGHRLVGSQVCYRIE